MQLQNVLPCHLALFGRGGACNRSRGVDATTYDDGTKMRQRFRHAGDWVRPCRGRGKAKKKKSFIETKHTDLFKINMPVTKKDKAAC